MPRVEVRSRIVGTTSEEQPSNVGIDLLNDSLTVEELISLTVEEQVRDLLIHRKLDAEKARQILQRQYLTEADVREQSMHGAVKHPTEKPQKAIDTQMEIMKALKGFEQGAYIIVVDGKQVEKLDEVVTLLVQSKVTFVRLTPLVGG